MKKTSLNILFTSIIFFTASISNNAYSQIDKNGGSIYSIFGLGDLNYSSSVRTDAMGVLGLSLYGNYTNSLNPAAWIRIPGTRFSTKFNFVNIKESDGTNNATRNYGNFEGFNLSIPLNQNNGWIFDMGINHFSIVNYDIKFDGTSGSENFTQIYSGNGGISRIGFGFSYLIFRHFGIGLQVNYTFGNITKSTTIDFVNPDLYDTRNRISNSLSGFYFNTGLIFHGLGKLLKSKSFDELNIGVFFSTPGKFNSSLSGRFETSAQTDSLNFKDGKIDIPWSAGFGISNLFFKKITVAADVFFQNWDNFKSYGVHPSEIKNNLRIGLGAEYIYSKKLDASFFESIAYRLGASYTSDYLRLKDKSINSYGVHAGLSLPISRLNSVDLSFNYSTRGTTSDGLIKDDVFKIGASINIGELWFLKPKEE
ncbi:MAG: OmpP1/FadL family transporter [Ignavibacteria bacterium]